MAEPAPRVASDDDFLALPEDLVGEILSPGTARTDRAIKMPIYADLDIPHLWLVHPTARTLETYRPQSDGHWLLLGTLQQEDAVRQPPFEAATFSPGMLWAWERCCPRQ